MTKKLFYEDAYMKEFDAEVVAVKEKGDKLLVSLDQSAFYPEGGGQGADDGELIIVSTAAQSSGDATDKIKIMLSIKLILLEARAGFISRDFENLMSRKRFRGTCTFC